MLEDVKEFADKFKQPKLDAPGFLPDEAMKQRLDFQLEELLETAHAAGFFFHQDKMEFKRMGGPISPTEYAEPPKRNLAEVLDGLVDQVYVALGTAYAMGFLKEINVWALPDEHPLYEEAIFFEHGSDRHVFNLAWKRVHRANMEKVSVPGMWKIQKPKGWVRPDLSDLVEGA